MAKRPGQFRKYLPRKVTRLDGHVFDSAGEAKRYATLRMLERGNVVRNLECHPKYPMHINGKKLGRGYMILDFRYELLQDGLWVPIIEDFKGIDTRESAFRRQVCEAVNNITIKVTTYDGYRRGESEEAGRCDEGCRDQEGQGSGDNRGSSR